MVMGPGKVPAILLRNFKYIISEEGRMRLYYKIHSIFISFLYLLFILPVVFAQNIDVLKSDIYSKLKCCPCQVSFDKCTCSEAKEIKAYVDALLESGSGKEEIFYKVAKKFSLNTILDEQIKQDIEKELIRQAGQSHPQILIDSTSYNFGRVSKKQGKITKTFNLSNKGNSVLIIRNLKTTCPCATVSLKVNKKKSPYFGTEGAPGDWQIEIKPQEFGELELRIDLASSHVKPGKLIREASIFSNDPVYPELKVRVEAEVTD